MLEVKKYSTTELLSALNISSATWKRRQEEFLEYFHYFFSYNIETEGRAIFYNVTEVYAEYQPMPRKTKRDEIITFYRNETHKIVDYDPWNTGSNVARRILDKENRYIHSEGTAANYVRPILKEDYLRIDEEAKWFRADYDKYEYIELTEEQDEYLKGLLAYGTQYAMLAAQVEAGSITKEEMGRAITEEEMDKYNNAMKAFKRKFGFRPLLVPKYQAKAF